MNNGAKSSEVPGGGGNPQVDSLDMADGRDRALLRSRDPRWFINEEMKARYILALDAALGLAIKKNDQRALVSCVRTLATLEGQNQADDHVHHKYDRIDAGKPTETVQLLDPSQAERAGKIASRFDDVGDDY